eukprot:TRINITY_DN10534_c0_g1_i1.p1 TRINITY_DN10534_c0_g1~~TRINITY_DN10534_c0_g1_i1.p1  ORF type:complete len:414 (+),score=47.30 TRINITY_DN10534_c0_g1_i1:23-1264(+)
MRSLSRVVRAGRRPRSSSVRQVPPRRLHTSRISFHESEKSEKASGCGQIIEPVGADKKLNIVGLSREELEQEFKIFQVPTYRVDQVWQWLYQKGCQSFQQMPNISKDLKEKLDSHFVINWGTTTADTISADGTRKLLINFDGSEVESVYIPETSRGTLCISSQVGCTFACTFCHTGTQGLQRNLRPSELVSQLLTAKKLLFDFGNQEGRAISNLVFMGQGEPFYNYRNLKKALNIITDPKGLAMSKRKITVSTSGVVPNIEKLGQDFPGMGLAISLHAPDDKLRSEIVTANRQWPLAELINACKNYPSLSPNNRITFEYVMLKGVNDSVTQAKQLAALVKGFPSLINLIPFNPWPGSQYESSSTQTIVAFAQAIEDAGVAVTVRWPRGRDILAACGQLKTETIKKRETAASST